MVMGSLSENLDAVEFPGMSGMNMNIEIMNSYGS